MTFEKILSDLTFDNMSAKQAYDQICQKDKLKTINYYVHIENITKEPLKEGQLQELNAIVGILQILYNANVGSPISDPAYDTLQEMLIDMGIPRLTGSVEINDAKKVSHQFTNLRGTLDKVYYLFPDEKRTNKSRKYLDEWIKSAEERYFKATGKRIDLNKVKIMLQPKFDGTSVVLERLKKMTWITRGDTKANRASDVSKIMNIFNDVFSHYPEGTGIKFEAMMTEDNKEKINELCREKPYKNSRQIVTSIFNSNEPDFKAEYLYPVPLRIVNPGDELESIHPDLIEKFPTAICTFGDRETIREFANENRWVLLNGMRFRTDGAVMTILDPEIQKVLGRENDINKFEVAYKFTEEFAYTRVKDVEFYVSPFGIITPVLVTNDVILKGNTVNHISLSNKERFDELGLCYGDEVKVLYDIIPYVTIDEKCRLVQKGRKIKFIDRCPMCREPLNLGVVQVQCSNPKCPSRIIGRVLNYCTTLRIQNIGYQTLDTLYNVGLLNHGIRSLYKLKKHTHEIEDLEGFGKLKSKKMVAEVEAKRRLKDYEFFGALGIEGLSTKTFQLIFAKIKLQEFLDMIRLKNFDLLVAHLTNIKGIGDAKADLLVEWFKENEKRSELQKLLKEVTLFESYGPTENLKGRIVFTGIRPNDDQIKYMRDHGWYPSDSWSNQATALVIPQTGYGSSKVDKANDKGVPIVALDGRDIISALIKEVPNFE
ncbi:MAG: hypothetical protein NC548_37030 [Lachnospiraceae bacterium]|nr:hypothetical protein [Lachnospiraceae bacterium]MCM1234647.1 hypothetical protein [Ruminococcus flavefaciens]